MSSRLQQSALIYRICGGGIDGRADGRRDFDRVQSRASDHVSPIENDERLNNYRGVHRWLITLPFFITLQLFD